MIDPQSQVQLRQEVTERMVADRALLDKLRLEVARLRPQVRRIRERNTTSISLVATDGGNNRLFLDPFLVRSDLPPGRFQQQRIRPGSGYPTTSVFAFSTRQFDASGQPRTALGGMLAPNRVKGLGLIHTTTRA